MSFAIPLRRLLARGCVAGLGALLVGCAALPDDPYATPLPPGGYGGGVYVPGTPYPPP